MQFFIRLGYLFALGLALISPLAAQTNEKRIALVIGNADYQAGPLQTSANDAGLIAQTLQAAGFDVVGARDLDQESLRRSLIFLTKPQHLVRTRSLIFTSPDTAYSLRAKIISFR
jgi:hypothetical protein